MRLNLTKHTKNKYIIYNMTLYSSTKRYEIK